MVNVCEKNKLQVESFFEGDLPYVKIGGKNLPDVSKTFDCGQSFRFERVENSGYDYEYGGVAFGRFVSFANGGDCLYIFNCDERDFYGIWLDYLGMNDDYEEIDKDILSRSDTRALKNAVEFGRGIHILKQEPWEALCSFIISQNNNIPRIKKIIESLSLRCGTPIELCEEAKKHTSSSSSLCSFPSAEALLALGEAGLFELKTGFRAKYIFDAVSRTIDGRLSFEKIYAEPDIERAIELLCEVKGIGRKVASCALLFGFNKYDAFPIDVWMKRVAEKYFSELGDSLSGKTFGEYAGIAQQYLFYYERWNNNAINE